MRKPTLLLALVAPTLVYAEAHFMEFKFERRGDVFQRHFAELHSAWDQRSPQTMTHLGKVTMLILLASICHLIRKGAKKA